MKMTHRLKGMETSFRDLSGPKAGLNLLPIFINIPGTPKCTISLVDGGRLRTFLCETMHMLCSSGYTLSGIYNDDLSWSPRTQLPKNVFSQPFFDVIYIPVKHCKLWGIGKVKRC